MATNPVIKPKRGTSTPGVSALQQNELAVDTTNKRIFIGAADGSGTLIGSAPGGSDTQVQFNDGGNLGGDAGLVYNKTTDALTMLGELNLNGGGIKTNQGTISIIPATATTVNFAGAATSLNLGTTSGTATISNPTLVGTQSIQSIYNTVATKINFAGATTDLVIGATTGATSIRNPTLTLGNTTSTISTNSGTSNSLTVTPYGSFLVSPTSSSSIGGSYTTLTITNSDQGLGQVQITGGDLYLGSKTDALETLSPSNIIFEGIADANELTLTVASLTADRTVTLPDGTGTLALLGTGSTTDGRIPYYDTTTNTFLGASALSYNDGTATLTLDAHITVGGTIGTTNSTVNLLNATATTINFGGAATTFNIGGASSATINLGKTDGTTIVDMNSCVLREVEMRSYFETEGTVTYTGGISLNLALDLSTGNVFVYTTTGSISNFTINNIPSKANTAVGFTVVLTCGNAGYTVNFDSFTSGGPIWAGGTPPTASNTLGRTDIVSYVTYDAGTTWYGMVGGLNFF